MPTAPSVRVCADDEELIVEVADDGTGGADPETGSGLLRGLADRLRALGGRLHVSSPPALRDGPARGDPTPLMIRP